MNPVKIEGATLFGAPPNWDLERDGPCFALPVHVMKHEDGPTTFTSIWCPTAEERRRIAAGENITLSIFGGQPPIMMSVDNLQGEIVRYPGDGLDEVHASLADIRNAMNDLAKEYPHRVDQALEFRYKAGWFVGHIKKDMAKRKLKVSTNTVCDEVNRFFDELAATRSAQPEAEH